MPSVGKNIGTNILNAKKSYRLYKKKGIPTIIVIFCFSLTSRELQFILVLVFTFTGKKEKKIHTTLVFMEFPRQATIRKHLFLIPFV